MQVLLHKRAFEELRDWAKTDPKVVKRILELINNIAETPFSGIGKPEPLKHELTGFWSRRITDEHRLVYTVIDGNIAVISCKTHYS